MLLVAVLQRPSAGEMAALGMVLAVLTAWGTYRPADNRMLCVDLAEYFRLKKHLQYCCL